MKEHLLRLKLVSLLTLMIIVLIGGMKLNAQPVTDQEYKQKILASQLKEVDAIVNKEIAGKISETRLANQQGYYQNLSLKSAMGTAAISETDSMILVKLYNSTNGSGWINKTNWLTGQPIRTWFGVTVVVDEITQIDLQKNNLTGEIPIELGGLTSLLILDLDTNQITGTIPVELGNLTNLKELYLSGNELTGSIPVELGNLTNLNALYLSDNQLSDTIPAFTTLSILEYFDLSENQLTGSIPVELASLTNLKFLDLGSNLLTGTIAEELGQLTNMIWLDLRSNQFSGSIPNFGVMPNLRMLYLNSNNLTGSIPTELAQLTNLVWLHLGQNQLTGSIPVALNQLVDLEQLYLDENQLTGSIPTELGTLTNLIWMNLSQNQLTGSIPVSFNNLAMLLLLYLDHNQLDGSLPIELGDVSNLRWVFLNNNFFSGDIPVELGQLADLEWLFLNDNQLTGSVPVEITQLATLLQLDLNGNLLDNLPEITAPDFLTELNVSDNKFSFEDLEYNMDLLPMVSFTYSPQDYIGTSATFIKNEGDNFSDTLSTGGTQNNYQWYKDGEILSTQTDSILLINNLTAADAGKYYCKVTNTLVPGLTLTSREITLTMKLCVKLVFNVGWNIFSSPVTLEPAKMDSIFKPFIIKESLVKIQDEVGGTFENRGVFGGWTNDIGDIVTTEGYKIKMSIKDSVVICGLPVEYPFEIPLKQGWNIMGYPQIAEFSGMEVVQTLIDKKVLIKVQDEKGGTIEDRGVYGGWTNGIGSFITGEGYKIKVTKDTSLWINESYPKSNVILPEIVASTHFKPAFEGNGVDHMNINLVSLTGTEIMEGDEIGIFDGNICVGSTKIARQNSSVINVIASADEGNALSNGFKPGNQIQMKLFRNGKEYALEIAPLNSSSNQFEKNGTIFATVNTALNTGIDLPENEFSVACYPNPFNQILNIEINLQQREELTVEVYDLLSRRINQLYSGSAEGMIKLQWDASDSQGNRVVPGVYVCRVNGLWKKIVLN